MAIPLTRIFTDGSYSRKYHAGSYGIVMLYKNHEKQIKGEVFRDSTSQRMEIMAVIVALETVSKDRKFEYLLHIDSQYVVNSITKGWVFRWEKSNFDGYANADLWKRFLKVYREFKKDNLRFKWVKGHVGHKYNELADQLANHWRDHI